MNSAANISFLVAFIAGVASFLSPCILPLIPSYLSYLTGLSFRELSGESSRSAKKEIALKTFSHSLFFVAGFTAIFVLLGATATFLGHFLLEYQGLLKNLSGVLIIFFGLIIAGIIRIPFLEKGKKFSYTKKSISFIGSFFVGCAFAVAWTPCVGPILGSILVYASGTAELKKGIALLFVFSLGLGVPFILSALALNTFLAYFKRIERKLKIISVVAGFVLVVFGVLLLIRG